jgi:hypothetical protein
MSLTLINSQDLCIDLITAQYDFISYIMPARSDFLIRTHSEIVGTTNIINILEAITDGQNKSGSLF